MNEVSEMWKAHNEARKQQHEEWYIKNLNSLKKSGLRYTHKDTVCLFRIQGKPLVDFYPHTGRWRIVGKDSPKKVFTGGADAFINWFRKQYTNNRARKINSPPQERRRVHSRTVKRGNEDDCPFD